VHTKLTIAIQIIWQDLFCIYSRSIVHKLLFCLTSWQRFYSCSCCPYIQRVGTIFRAYTRWTAKCLCVFFIFLPRPKVSISTSSWKLLTRQ